MLKMPSRVASGLTLLASITLAAACSTTNATSPPAGSTCNVFGDLSDASTFYAGFASNASQCAAWCLLDPRCKSWGTIYFKTSSANCNLYYAPVAEMGFTPLDRSTQGVNGTYHFTFSDSRCYTTNCKPTQALDYDITHPKKIVKIPNKCTIADHHFDSYTRNHLKAYGGLALYGATVDGNYTGLTVYPGEPSYAPFTIPGTTKTCEAIHTCVDKSIQSTYILSYNKAKSYWICQQYSAVQDIPFGAFNYFNISNPDITQVYLYTWTEDER